MKKLRYLLFIAASFSLSFLTLGSSASDIEPKVKNLMTYDEEASPVGQIHWDEIKGHMPETVVANEYGVFQVTMPDKPPIWLDSSMFEGATGVICDEQDIASAAITGAGSVTTGGMGAGGSC